MIRKLSERLCFTACVPEGSSSGTHVFLSLGSNLGDRKKFLEEALFLLQKNQFFIVQNSSIYETSPVGCEEGAASFYNIVTEGIWDSDAFALLALCKKIETELGRPADHAHWVSRNVDVDIIFFGEELIHTPVLTVPHPLAKERAFVLAPLAEIAAERIFPGRKESCRQLRERLEQETKA